MRPFGGALAALALASGGIAAAFTWQPGLGSLFDDSVSYLLLAQAASPYAAASEAVAEAASLEKYPPLFAWILALAGGASDWRIAHAVVAVSFGAAVALLGLLARTVTRSEVLGLAAAGAFALMPGAWLNVKGILTEFPFMAASFAALWLHARLEGRAPGRGTAAALGLLVAAALLTRTIGAALAAAIAGAELVRYARDRDRARLAGVAAVVAVPALAALAWHALRASAGEDAYGAYAARVAGEAGRGGAGYLAGLALANAAAIRDAWLTALMVFWGEPWKPQFLLSAGLGLAGLAATAVRAAKAQGDGLYVVTFLAILLVWPFPGQMFRLALPVAPLVAMHFLWGAARLAERRSLPLAHRWAAALAVLPLAACAPATLFFVAPRAAEGATSGVGTIAEYYRIPDRRAALASAEAQLGILGDLRRLRDSTPAGARVMWYSPGYVTLLGDRHAAPLERPRDAADLARQALAARAEYVYLGELHPRDSAARDGHPLAPLPQALALGSLVWHRASAAGAIRGALVKLDPVRVESAAR